jgi:hypothetical protein
MLSIRPITGLLTAAALVSSSEAADGPSTPDMSGWWSRLTFGFELPDSGAGPVGRLRGGQVGQGNFDSPILTPLAATVMKERGARAQVGDYPIPSSQCLPMASPYILRVQEIQLLQKKDEVLFLFMQDHQVRRVRLNAQHPTHVTPSWYGDSIGHYEGDTLVVDTIGFKLGPFPVVDERSGAPFSEALHVVERYRLIDYEVAKAAQAKNIRDSGPVGTEQAASVDENYKGKGLQVRFTVEDKNVFTTPWSGAVTYRRAAEWVENVCAENTHEYYNNGFTKVPEAKTPDF